MQSWYDSIPGVAWFIDLPEAHGLKSYHNLFQLTHTFPRDEAITAHGYAIRFFASERAPHVQTGISRCSGAVNHTTLPLAAYIAATLFIALPRVTNSSSCPQSELQKYLLSCSVGSGLLLLVQGGEDAYGFFFVALLLLRVSDAEADATMHF